MPKLKNELYLNWNPAQDSVRHQTDPIRRAALQRIAEQPTAIWLTETSDLDREVGKVAKAAGLTACLVLYAIPQRDCGSASSGGFPMHVQYRRWVDEVCTRLEAVPDRSVIVIIEPDALGLTKCLDLDSFGERLDSIRWTVGRLRAAGVHPYIDASVWAGARRMATRLTLAGLSKADGFALNVSLSQTSETCHAFADEVRMLTGMPRKLHIIDTSRNGAGPAPDGAWKNPQMLKLGDVPTLLPGRPKCRGELWVKRPGSSDGPFEGGPAAGQWWEDYAVLLGTP